MIGKSVWPVGLVLVVVASIGGVWLYVESIAPQQYARPEPMDEVEMNPSFEVEDQFSEDMVRVVDVGSPAPDFTLLDITTNERWPKDRLLQTGKPIVLIFGSLT